MIASGSFNQAVALDAADGVLDGRYYGQQIGVTAPVYRTPPIAPAFGAGLYGSVNALSTGAYPSYYPGVVPSAPQYPLVQPQYPVSQYPAVAVQPQYPVTSVTRPVAVAPVTSSVSVTRPVAVAPVTQTHVEYFQPPVQYIAVRPPPVPVQVVRQIQYVQSPPVVQYLQAPPEIRYIEAPPQPAVLPPPAIDPNPELLLRIRELEEEIATLRIKLTAKAELKSQTRVSETYKVKTFEIAAKLAVMDGTDDGLYNGLPIEVEGEGLYRDLVAQGRRPRENISLTGRQSSITTMSETYKVQSYEMADKLSKMDGTDDGLYNGLPIEVAGQGLYRDLKARRAGGY